jgi:hypothetical protein
MMMVDMKKSEGRHVRIDRHPAFFTRFKIALRKYTYLAYLLTPAFASASIVRTALAVVAEDRFQTS